MVNVEVGNRKVISTNTILIPENETAKIILTPITTEPPLFLDVVFEQKDDAENSLPSCSITGSGQNGVMTFTNWTNNLGSHIMKPIFFATTDGGYHVSCIFIVTKIGNSYRLDIQFMLGENKE
ncbi:DUF6864 domain-containing function [Aeromonas rivipollensis]|uniref:DUF6864 domain-containing function n=1 Tax=Aeromonas rivipollensis TaxID=948519 RepID=UPI003D192DF3